jgi:hypothetical protein
MRVAELFKRLLGLSGVRVVGVDLIERAGSPWVVVHIARPAARAMACSGCGQVVAGGYDRSERRWRHRDLAGVRCEIRAEVRRLSCPACGVRPEAVPWARPGARFTRPFEDTCAWLTRHAPKRIVAELMRIDWERVGRVAARVVAEARAGGDGLQGLRRIGVDEVSWRAGHHHLTVVTCHDQGRVVWVGSGDRARALAAFFDQLGPRRAAAIEAVSADLGAHYLAIIRARAPQAAICADPFHLVQMAGFALDRLRAAAWQALRIADPDRARWLKGPALPCAAARAGADRPTRPSSTSSPGPIRRSTGPGSGSSSCGPWSGARSMRRPLRGCWSSWPARSRAWAIRALRASAGPCAPTRPRSSTPPASGSPTGASRPSTAPCACSATAPGAFAKWRT